MKDLLDFTCMIADKFSKDAKVKLTLFQKNRADDGVDAETFFARFFWNKVNFTFASFENLSAIIAFACTNGNAGATYNFRKTKNKSKQTNR